MGIIKGGKVVILLAGRYAGRKAVVMSASEEGNGDKKFGHAVVAGIDRYPKKVTRAMGKKRLEKRCKVKPFVKTVNFVHLMPTRYSVDMELKKFAEGASAVNTRTDTKKAIKKVFEERYKSQTGKTDKKAGGVQYFFNKLRF